MTITFQDVATKQSVPKRLQYVQNNHLMYDYCDQYLNFATTWTVNKDHLIFSKVRFKHRHNAIGHDCPM